MYSNRARSTNTLAILAGIFAALFCVAALFSTGTTAYADECPAGGDHDFDISIEQPATEDCDGVRLYVCKKCGYSYEEAIPATGHLWGPWIVDVAPTCISEGHEYRVCTRYPDSPHEEEQIIPALSSDGTHDYVVSEHKDPTCTEPGCTTYVCSVCGDTYTEDIPALGHSWGEWVIDEEPTATEEGIRHRTCRNDSSHVETETIPILEETVPDEPESEAPMQQDCSGADPIVPICIALDIVIAAVFAAAAHPLMCRLRWIDARHADALRMAKERGAWL